MRFFGLHIARTGGTSLADMAVQRMGKSRCLLVSSFSDSQRDYEQLPQERAFDTLPDFVFGHYVHESLLGLMLNSGPVLTFCILRDPRQRFESAVRHLLALGVSRENAIAKLAENPNPLCQEILRCIPMARVLRPNATLHEQAVFALSAFARVEQMTAMPALARELADHWGMPDAPEVPHLNAQPTIDPDGVLEKFDFDSFLEEDILLWACFFEGRRPHQAPGLVRAIRDLYADPVVAVEVFRMHLDRYMIEELNVLQSKETAAATLRKRIVNIERVIRVLESERASRA